MGLWGGTEGEQGQSWGMAERTVGFSDVLQHVYPLPSLSTHPTTHPAHTKAEVYSLDDSGLRAPGRLKDCQREKNSKQDEVKLHMFNGRILGHLPCPASRMLAAS